MSASRIWVALMTVLTLIVSDGVLAQQAQPQKQRNVVILATGGTIAGAAASGTQAGYTSGAVTIPPQSVGNDGTIRVPYAGRVNVVGATAADVEKWDSLNHINFIVAVEKAFGVKFKNAEIARLEDVGGLKRLVAKYRKAAA